MAYGYEVTSDCYEVMVSGLMVPKRGDIMVKHWEAHINHGK